ncbi:Na+/melibiose symporter-like transporter [Ureibacillus xyleni]|uniref:Na+/melibiose symporter-like transporter n=1 Tax=Ureibacillus xyleni TaxID=614648 RepID=A0A285RD40_9BACL|nr:MFS transporter [Ureibacillus xyleni]SOB91981.1 Na+/melibiose symporter-like transporter [Ureibacillus xyleni]
MLRKTLKFHPIAWGLIIGTFLSRAGFFMSIPFLGIYLHEVMGFSTAMTGTILSISFFVSTFTSFIGGAWSDKVGRFPVMIISMYLWGIVFVGFTVASEVWHYFVLNALSGFCRSIFEPSARALLVDVTPQEKRVDVFNMRYFAINVGGAIGPLIGLSLGASKTALPFLVSALLYFLYGSLIFVWKYKYSSINISKEIIEKVTLFNSLKIISKDKVFRFFLIGNIFVTGGYAHIDTTLSQYLGSDGIEAYSVLFATNAISILVLQYPIINLMKRYSPLISLKTGSILFGIGIFGFSFSHSLPLMIIAMVIFTIGEILCFIIGDVLIGDIAPDHLRGAYFGAAGLQFIGQSAGAAIGGMLLNMFGFESGFLVFGILAILTILAYPFFERGQYLLNTKFSDNNLTLPIKNNGATKSL